MLKMNDCKKILEGNEILKGIDTAVANKRTAIIGKNGAGKTTLLKLIVGLTKPDSGEVLFLEEDLFENPMNRKKISYVPIESFFYEKLSVFDNLKLVASLYGVRNFKSSLIEISKITQIESFLNKSVEDLSSGMKKKLALAASLLTEPDLIVLDEPFNALDVASISLFTDILLNFNGSIIFTSHIPETVYELAERVIVLKDGKISDDVNMDRFSHYKDFHQWMRNIID
ncbi:ABC transporter ATP-binding protein [Bacillus massilinigeriensis]|uniref:ABC transporter ATP-binding protein n=1 Tax=Bacillus mediterraneensis TaxID=1805474 RepID=UPI0008F914E2|nr:ABC transporter ATP-binding protein [Bacillus mediterraneensis]